MINDLIKKLMMGIGKKVEQNYAKPVMNKIEQEVDPYMQRVMDYMKPKQPEPPQMNERISSYLREVMPPSWNREAMFNPQYKDEGVYMGNIKDLTPTRGSLVHDPYLGLVQPRDMIEGNLDFRRKQLGDFIKENANAEPIFQRPNQMAMKSQKQMIDYYTKLLEDNPKVGVKWNAGGVDPEWGQIRKMNHPEYEDLEGLNPVYDPLIDSHIPKDEIPNFLNRERYNLQLKMQGHKGLDDTSIEHNREMIDHFKMLMDHYGIKSPLEKDNPGKIVKMQRPSIGGDDAAPANPLADINRAKAATRSTKLNPIKDENGHYIKAHWMEGEPKAYERDYGQWYEEGNPSQYANSYMTEAEANHRLDETVKHISKHSTPEEIQKHHEFLKNNPGLDMGKITRYKQKKLGIGKEYNFGLLVELEEANNLRRFLKKFK